jgi:hypothetical protein
MIKQRFVFRGASRLLMFAFVWLSLIMTANAGDGQHVQRLGTADGLPPKQLATTLSPAPWIRKVQFADTVYLLYQFPFKLERFNLVTGTWLPTQNFDSVPTSIAVGSEGVFIGFNLSVMQFSLDFSSSQPLTNAWPNPTDIGLDTNLLFVVKDREIQTIRVNDGIEVGHYTSIGGYYTPERITVARSGNVIYGAQVGLSPQDILRIPYESSGTLGIAFSSPYHGVYPSTVNVYASDSGQYVTDDSGVIYNGADLTYANGSGGPVNDFIWVGTEFYALHPHSVARLNASFKELGMQELTIEAHALAEKNGNLFLFRDQGGPTAEKISIASLGKPASHAASEPGSPFLADYIDMSDAGIIYMFSAAKREIRRFSVPLWEYLDAITLPLSPILAAVDKQGDQVYVAYDGGRIGLVPSGATSEQFLTYFPVTAKSLAAADNFAMIVDYTGAWVSHRLANDQGSQTDWVEWNYWSREFSWCRNSRRFFHFRDDTSPNDLHFEAIDTLGQISARGESPYHGEVITSLPIRPNPNCAYVLLGSGQVFDGVSLALLSTLPTQLDEAVWIGSTLFTIQSGTGTSIVTRWTAGFTVSGTGEIAGEVKRMFTSGSNLIAVTEFNTRTRILKLPSLLTSTDLSAEVTYVGPPAKAGELVTFDVDFINNGFTGPVSAQLSVELNLPLTNLSWSCESSTQGVIPCGTTTGLSEVVSIPAGGWVTAHAFGNMPLDSVTDRVVSCSVSFDGADSVPENDVCNAVLELNYTIFENGFE